MVLPAAAMDEDPGDGNVAMLATSTRARQAVKRYFELDDQPTIKKTKKSVADTNRLFIPKLSPGLQAKSNHILSSGGVLSRNTGMITPWNTYPPSSYGGSSSSTPNAYAITQATVAADIRLPQDAPMVEDG